MRTASVLLFLGITIITQASARVIAIGDLHGDIDQAITALELAEVIDANRRWVGGKTIVVQTGDVLDRGPHDLEILELFMNITNEAEEAGGMVQQLLGNHEMLNLVQPEVRKSNDPRTLEERQKLLSMKSPLGRYLRTRRAILQLGKYLFMHGGLSRGTTKVIRSVDDIEPFNTAIREYLTTGKAHPFAAAGSNLTESDDEPQKNPIVTRSMRKIPCSELDEVLRENFPSILSTVVGHVPHNPDNFVNWYQCGGRRLEIDFGMSRWKSGRVGRTGVLLINDTDHSDVSLIRSAKTNVTLYNPTEFIRFIEKEGRHHWILAGVLVGIFVVLAVGVIVNKKGLFIRNPEGLTQNPQPEYGTCRA